jgi:hypothetical protein
MMDTCPICIDPISYQTKLKCGHEFCEPCISKYKAKGGNCCPCCRKPFTLGRIMSKKDQLLLLKLQYKWYDDDDYDLQIKYTKTSRIMTMRYNDIECVSIVDRV